ncbi:MAG: DUF4423 domain-containing protein [Bdellovibrio sp.]|nr:DUF4423 domain-containing protein [Bdellovibrio sp.]
MNKAEILNYKDYRAFLVDYNTWKGQNKVGWSLSVWTRQLGLSHASALSMILNRKRHIGDRLVESMCQYFDFNAAEKSHFVNLVKYEKSIESSELRIMVLNHLDGEKNNVLARYIMREGLGIARFEDRESLAAALAPILGMKNAELSEMAPEIPDKPDPKAMHQEVVDLLKRSYEVVPREKRQYSTNFIRMKADRLPEAIAKLRAFQKEFIAEFDGDDGDALVCFQNALFSMLTEKSEETADAGDLPGKPSV